ncbi:MAG: sigma-54-dependent Fis family transcriptional regulator [Rhodothermales bacterium]|nr:sigma-54-dependent Fis family transcriptional regulator [Rhodothermales bacterium]
MPLVLIVDDVPALAEQYAYDLRRLGDFETRIAGGGKEALELLQSEPVDCMILDLEMPGMDGFAVLRALEEWPVVPPVIVYTGTGNFDRCIQAIRLGATGFIDKAEPMLRVVLEVQKAIENERLSDELGAMRERLRTGSPLVGSSPAMDQLRVQIRRLAPIPSAVLILGESGTGKELVARELHREAGDDRPFVALNAGAIPENLVESELFGHEKGAFTGADRLHRGAFERAAGGTLFLDEIGELSQSLQARLLRVLESREFQRVGGERPVKMSCRVVAATHRDLDTAAKEGSFRTDLLFRLNTHVLQVPPLRDRRSDIPDLVGALLLRISRDFGIRAPAVSPEVMSALTNHAWQRNNVRELRNVLERLVLATDTDVITETALPQTMRSSNAPGAAEGARPAGTFAERKAEAERAIIVQALREHDGHVTQTANALGLADHASLLKIMRRLGIERS